MATRIYKKCTKCNRFYIEKDLLFCLKDGTTLMVIQDEENTSDQKAKTYMPSVLVSNKQNQTTQFAYGQMSNTKAEVSARWGKAVVNLQPTISAEATRVKKEEAKTNEPSQRQNNLLTTMAVTNKKNGATNNEQAKKSNNKVAVIITAVVLVLLVVSSVSAVAVRSASFKSSEATGLIDNRGLGLHNISVPNENDIEGKNKKRTTTTKTTTTKTTTTRQPSTNQEETIQIGGNGIPVVVTIRVP